MYCMYFIFTAKVFFQTPLTHVFFLYLLLFLDKIPILCSWGCKVCLKALQQKTKNINLYKYFCINTNKKNSY